MSKSKEVLFCDHCEMETFHEDGKCFECRWIPVKGELSMKSIANMMDALVISSIMLNR